MMPDGSHPLTMGYEAFQSRLWRLLEPGDDPSPTARRVATAISTLVVINVLAVMIETVPSMSTPWLHAVCDWIESISISVFTVEYAARLWASGADPQYRGAFGRLQYMGTPMAIIDLLAIVPGFVASTTDLRTLRLFRVLYLLRILKLGRTSRALRTLGRVLFRTRSELAMCGAVAGLLLLIASSLIYFAEREAQPDVFSSIPHAMWWATAALTTVGYGDVVPVTPFGKMVGSVIAFIGMGLFALPAGVLGGAFMKELEGLNIKCPHCGRAPNDPE